MNNPNSTEKIIEELVKEIMQAGLDVSMGGDPFKSEEENKEWGEKEYDRVVKKYTKSLNDVAESAREETIEKIEKDIKKYEQPMGFGSASGGMMKGAVLDYLNSLKSNKQEGVRRTRI